MGGGGGWILTKRPALRLSIKAENIAELHLHWGGKGKEEVWGGRGS